MSRTLSNGYTVVRIEGVQRFNGTSVADIRDEVEKIVTVTDDGCDRDTLVDRTAAAVHAADVAEAARVAKQQAHESSIEVLYGLAFKRVPVLPDDSLRLPYGRRQDR